MHFRSERIDDIIIFGALGKKHTKEIVDILMSDLKDRLKDSNIYIKYDKKVRDLIAEKGFDPKHGARPLKRAIQEHFEDNLADALLKKNVYQNVDVTATVKNKTMQFSIQKNKTKKKDTKVLTPSKEAALTASQQLND